MHRVWKSLLAAGMAAALLIAATACSGPDPEGGAGSENAASGPITLYFIPKNLGNPYFDALSSGFYDAISELGEDKFQYVYTGPDVASPDNQIPFVEEAVQRGAFAIFIAANSNDALNATFDAAREAGVRVYVINQDIPGSEAHRDAAILPVNFDTVGEAQLRLLAEQLGYEDKFAILSATADAPDQNMWIGLMKEELAGNPVYARMELLEVFYGDDQLEKSAAQTRAIISKYPDVKGILAPTAVGITAACQVVQEEGLTGQVKVAGLGLPSEMADFVKNGVCEGFQLWNPPYEGYLAVYMVWAEKNGAFTPAPGASFSAGKLGERSVLPNGQLLTLETPMLYDRSNIDEYSILF